jgi:hypothetical protein
MNLLGMNSTVAIVVQFLGLLPERVSGIVDGDLIRKR